MEPEHHASSAVSNRRLVRLSLAAALVAGLGGLAWASGDWSGAQHKVEEFRRRADEVARQAPAETRKIVAAICAADDESRRSEADSASSSARSHINDKLGELERNERDALDALEQVERDDKLKDRQSDARSLASDVKSRWDKVKDLTRGVRDSRHPVVDFMLSRGESARHDQMARCDAKDVSLSWGHAECVLARGDTCTVVSLTADSSRAISKGRDRASRSRSTLDDELKKPASDVMKQLIDRNHEFAKCKRFEVRVDCYKLCPDIGDDNRNSEPGPSWRQGC
jgi:hypothetical protein